MKKKKTPQSLVRYRIVKSMSQRTSGLPSKYLQAIGELAVNFASLEHQVLLGISWLSRETDFRRILCLVGGEKFDMLKSKLEKMLRLKIKNEDIKDEFESIITRLNEANSARNKYVHSIWVVKNGLEIFRSSAPLDAETEIFKYKMHMGKDGSLSLHEPVTLALLQTEVEKVAVLIQDLSFFLFEISGRGKKRKRK